MTDKTLTIALGHLTDFAPLFRQYAGQVQPQPAYITLDESGRVTAVVDGTVGSGVPADVFHRRTLRWAIDPDLSANEIDSLVRHVRPLLERVAEGHEVTWQGGERVGRLSGDAESASFDIERVCREEQTETVGACSIGDYLAYVAASELVAPDETVEHAAQRWIEDAHANHARIAEDADQVADYLRDRHAVAA